MPKQFLTPHEMIESALQLSGVQGITWANANVPGSPYYQEAPEGQSPDKPYVVFNVQLSAVDHEQGSGYIEEYKVTVVVVATSPLVFQLSSPYGLPGHSVFAFLDTFAETPQLLSGQNFKCTKFYRESYAVEGPQDLRAPSQKRAWEALAEYTYQVSAPYPQLPVSLL